MTDQPTPRAPEPGHITERDEVLGELFREVGLEYEGPRYVTVQIDYPTWTEMREAANRVARHAARGPEPSAPDDLQEQIAAAIDACDQAVMEQGATEYDREVAFVVAVDDVLPALRAVMGVLRREGLVRL